MHDTKVAIARLALGMLMRCAYARMCTNVVSKRFDYNCNANTAQTHAHRMRYCASGEYSGCQAHKHRRIHEHDYEPTELNGRLVLQAASAITSNRLWCKLCMQSSIFTVSQIRRCGPLFAAPLRKCSKQRNADGSTQQASY